MNCEQVERSLGAYVDRESTSMRPDHPRARGNLPGVPAAGRRARGPSADWCGQCPRIRRPARLRAQLAQAGDARRKLRLSQLVTWAAAAAVVLAVGAGFVVQRASTSAVDRVAEEVVSEHVRSLMANHLFDVESTDQHAVKPWFLGKLDFAPPVVDLSADGYPLLGGPLGLRPWTRGGGAQSCINGESTRSTCSSSRHKATRAWRSRRGRCGFHLRHWTGAGMAFWAVSDLADAELSEFARALQRN